jgi:hypothetical protein
MLALTQMSAKQSTTVQSAIFFMSAREGRSVARGTRGAMILYLGRLGSVRGSPSWCWVSPSISSCLRPEDISRWRPG